MGTPDARTTATSESVRTRPPLDSRLAASRRGGGQRGTWLQKSGSITRRQSRPASHHSAKTHHRGGSGGQTRRAGWWVPRNGRNFQGASTPGRAPLARRSSDQEPEINTTIIAFALPWFAMPSLDILCERELARGSTKNGAMVCIFRFQLPGCVKRHDVMRCDAMRCGAVRCGGDSVAVLFDNPPSLTHRPRSSIVFVQPSPLERDSATDQGGP